METKETTEETRLVQAPSYLFERLRARLVDRLRFHPREAGALAVLGLLLVVGAGLAYVRARPAVAAIGAPSGAVATASPAASVAANTIIVDVAGAVRTPGVYDFPQGARVIDAIRK